MGYFDLADAIGHLSFGIPKKMKMEDGYLIAEASEELVSFISGLDDLFNKWGIKEKIKSGKGRSR